MLASDGGCAWVTYPSVYVCDYSHGWTNYGASGWWYSQIVTYFTGFGEFTGYEVYWWYWDGSRVVYYGCYAYKADGSSLGTC